jgi:cytoskeleton protein RodZ
MMNTQQDDQISNMDSATGQPLSVGKTLREAREQLGLSVNDVANRIKFAPKQIEWLEAEDYVRLPEAAFVRGFVRSYARLLELDPARLLSGLPSSHVQASSTQEVKSVEIPLPSALSARRHNIIWLAAALVIAVSLAIFERLHDRVPEVAEPVAKATVESSTVEGSAAANTKVEPLDLPNVSAESESVALEEQKKPAVPAPLPAVRTVPAAAPKAAVTAAPQPAPQPVVRAAPVTASQPVVRAAPAPAPQQSVPPKAASTAPLPQPWQPFPQKTAPAVAAPVATAASAPVSEEPKVNAEINASEHKLRLELDEDAWIEVKDASDKILISKMHSAGSLVRVTGKAPLLVTVGNARAVRLFDNGKKINLERYTTAEVARVKLK